MAPLAIHTAFPLILEAITPRDRTMHHKRAIHTTVSQTVPWGEMLFKAALVHTRTKTSINKLLAPVIAALTLVFDKFLMDGRMARIQDHRQIFKLLISNFRS